MDASSQTLHGTLECGEPIAKIFSQPLELVQIEVCCRVSGLEQAGVVTVVLVTTMAWRLLKIPSLGGEARPGSL
jgi:hypothetical protein